MANPLPNRRDKIDHDELVRANIPKHLRDAESDQITASIKPNLEGFLSRIVEARRRGVSLYLYGGEGTGKTGAGVVIVKEARHWGLTAYTISVADLREALRNRKMFDGEASVFDRVRSVDVLLLDSVSVADKDERIFSLREISNLIVSRFDQGLVTVITSLESPGDWRKKGCAELSNAMHKSCVTLQVTGGNRHDQSLEGKVDILKPIAEPMPDPEKMKFLAPK